MVGLNLAPAQIWQDDCYYLNEETGRCERKYWIILAVSPDEEDLVTAVFTSKSNGLIESPACSLGPPRAGYYVGAPGNILLLPTWVDFSSVKFLDVYDLKLHIKQKRTHLTSQTLSSNLFCGVLRCTLQSEDISKRQASWIGDTAESLGCK